MFLVFSFHSKIVDTLRIRSFNCGRILSNDVLQKQIFFQINTLPLLQKRSLIHNSSKANHTNLNKA